MSRFAKKILLLCILTGPMLVSFADRGIGKRSRAKIMLNVATTNSFKSSLSLNLKNGLKYKGSLLSDIQQQGCSLTSTELVTYQKGNSIYIVPYKPKIITPEVKPGYTGFKLIIKSN
ncbi:MAG: hypothetical protein IT254_03625 [Chitinophagaceae bacterium]|nr:hypothetical protein [Bacteroidota bacterium]MCC6257389.1 hypothetical protein [Chitinophagaceae bacterium]MCW5916222.1 hypothetical protein [Ferruginibacter sp.]